MSKKHSKNWAEIQQDFNSMAEMSCVPSGIKKLRSDHVIDMDQSVRWNQEQVRLNNEKYQEEATRLNREKNKRRDAIYEDIYQKIQDEVGFGLTRGKAITLWNYAWECGHSAGISEVLSCLYELMDLIRDILSDEGGGSK
ncbi:hypothetical protein [uncultured Bacteroides sp.]|uniref:hypothetical protein n=1 Tax=uncultured Bacteroides sp. TaxID=162156 RepID=UPI002596BB7B|nr:hypothetical protein [uncultured Bacteroides sp.]